MAVVYVLLLLASSIFWLSCDSFPDSGLFVFGDSLVDVGSNDYISVSYIKANFSPYGIDFPGGKSTGRFGNGKIYSDFVAEYLGQATPPPFLCPDSDRSRGVNFASAGAGIMNDTDNHFYSHVIPLASQVDQFRSIQGTYTTEFLGKSIFLVSIGNLDFIGYRINPLRPPLESFITTINLQFEALIRDMIGAGARKVFFMGLPPLGCTPRFLSMHPLLQPGTCDEDTNRDIVEYNAAMQTMLDSIQQTSPGFLFSIHSTYGYMKQLIENTALYGFRPDFGTACCGAGPFNGVLPCGYTGATTCCSDRKSRVFWDLYHPTEYTAYLGASNGWNDSTFISRYTLQELASL